MNAVVKSINEMIQAKVPSKETQYISDGHHTFRELYEYRLAYNAALFNEWTANGKYNVHKSLKHGDGELCFGGGWFIVIANTPHGQISNHYRTKYWKAFRCEERELADVWDGHTPEVALQRLQSTVTNEIEWSYS